MNYISRKMELKKTNTKYQSVMIVDDCEIESYINEITIKKAGFAEKIFKHNGAVGSLEFLKNIEMLNCTVIDLLPSVIFLDINMPILDGFQFLDELNNFPIPLSKKIKIVILSSSENPYDIKRASQYKQVVKFLHKPLKKEDLNNIN